MASLVPSWTRLRDPRFTGRESPLPDFGLACEACGVSLAGAFDRVCGHCGEPFDPTARRPSRPWFVLEPAVYEPLPRALLEMILRDEQVPHLVRPGLSALGVAGFSVLLPSEFYFECRWLIQRAHQQLAAEEQGGRGEPWRCGLCGEENPAGFERCWNCGSGSGDRGGASSPELDMF